MWDKQQRSCDDEENRNEYLDLFRNEVRIPDAEELFRFSAISKDGSGEVETPTVRPARVDAWVAFVVRRLSSRETRGGQRWKFYADTQRSMLGLAMKELIGNVRAVLQHWVEAEMTSRQGKQMTHSVNVQLISERYPCVADINFLDCIFD